MATRSLIRSLALCLGLAALAGCGSPPPPVAVGTLERHRIELRAERQEPVLRLAVAEGQQVRAGDVVLELDARRSTARAEQARSALALAKARLAEAVRGSRIEDVSRARAQLAEAETALAESRIEFARVEDLARQGIQAQSALDAATAARDAAVARREAATAALRRLLNGSTVEELDQARAAVDGAAATLSEAELDLARLTVRAPRDGTIDALPFKVGDEPPAGAAVAVLLAAEAPFARVYVPAELRPGVAVGGRATVRVDGFDESFEGVVRKVSNEAAFTPYYSLTERDRKNLSYLAEIDLAGDHAAALPTGVPVEVSF